MSKQDSAATKIGSGHARGMAKQGLSELRAAFYPDSNVAQPTEYGVFGKETPGEVAQQRELDGDQEPSVLGQREKAAEAKLSEKGKADVERDTRAHERD